MNDYLLRILNSHGIRFMSVLIFTAMLFFGWLQPALSQSPKTQPEKTDAAVLQQEYPFKSEDSSKGKHRKEDADVSVKTSTIGVEKKARPSGNLNNSNLNYVITFHDSRDRK